MDNAFIYASEETAISALERVFSILQNAGLRDMTVRVTYEESDGCTVVEHRPFFTTPPYHNLVADWLSKLPDAVRDNLHKAGVEAAASVLYRLYGALHEAPLTEDGRKSTVAFVYFQADTHRVRILVMKETLLRGYLPTDAHAACTLPEPGEDHPSFMGIPFFHLPEERAVVDACSALMLDKLKAEKDDSVTNKVMYIGLGTKEDDAVSENCYVGGSVESAALSSYAISMIGEWWRARAGERGCRVVISVMRDAVRCERVASMNPSVTDRVDTKIFLA